MSFGVQQPTIERKPANIDGDDTSANQVGVPVTYVAGQGRIAMDPITPLYNLTSRNADSGGGKASSKGGGAGQTKNWYADVAYLVCVVPNDHPVDYIAVLILNHAVAWTGGVGRGATDFYAPITVPKYCMQSRLYWGRKDQPIDDLILAPRGARPTTPGFDARDPSTWTADTGAGVVNPTNGHYDQHPAYRNFCYWVFKQLFLGTSPSFPNLEVIIARNTKWLAGAESAPDPTGVNPIAAAYEITSDTFFGAGLPDSELDTASFELARTNTDNQRFAPVLTSTQSLRALMQTYTAYYEGWFRRRGDKLQAGYFARGDVDTSGLKVFGSDELTAEVSLKPSNLDDTTNSFLVQYTDSIARYYKPDTLGYDDGANQARVGEVRPDPDSQPYQADFIIHPDRALQFIAARGRQRATISANGSLSVKVETADGSADGDAGITAGDLCKLDSASLGLEYVLRIMGVTWPDDRGGEAKLDVVQETGHWPELYVPPAPPRDGDFVIEPAVITRQRIIEIPSGLRDSISTEIIVLAERTFVHLLGFYVYVSSDGGDTYNELGTSPFACRGLLAATAPASGNLLDTTVGFPVDLYGPDLPIVASQTDQARDDNTLLCFWGNRISSVGTVVALGAGRFQIFSRHGVFGTPLEALPPGTECWFALRANLVRFANENFVAGATRLFKLSSYVFGEAEPIGEVTAVPFTFGLNIPYHISALELLGQGNDRNYVGASPVFDWRDTSDLLPAALEVDPLAATTRKIFDDHKIRVRDAVTGQIVFEDRTPSQPYTYGFEQNSQSISGPRRSYYFEVSGIHRNDDNTTVQTAFSSLLVDNPAPPVVGNFAVVLNGTSVHASWQAVTDLDLGDYILHRGTAPGFTPLGIRAGEGTCVYRGRDSQAFIEQDPSTTFYYKAAASDRFGFDLLNYSAEVQIFRPQVYVEDLAPPSVSPPGPLIFTTGFSVTAAGDTGETICYNRNNVPVTPGDAVYSSALPVTDNSVIRFRSYKGNHQSPEVVCTYTYQTPGTGGTGGGGPVCAVAAIHKVNGSQGRSPVNLSLSCATSGATMHYQIDGAGYGTYTSGNILLDLDSILESYASHSGNTDSAVSRFNNATVGPPP